MVVDSPPQALRKLIKRLEPLSGCGQKMRQKLKYVFKTAEALTNASVEDIAKVNKITRPKALDIWKVLHGEMVPEPKWAGAERVVVWNKLTKRKVAGAAAPKADQAAVWLATHANYERYTGQDQQHKSELNVPEQCKMDEAAYERYCNQPSGDTQQLKTNLYEYGLKIAPMNTLQTSTATASLVAPSALESCCAAISYAAIQLGYEPGELQASLRQDLAAPSSSADVQLLLSVLQKASHMFKRPVWVFTSLASAECVYEVGDEVDPQRVAPLWLAQCGASFFPILSLSSSGAVGVELEVIEVVDEDVEPAALDDGDGGGEVQLPDIKEDLALSLRSVLALSDEAEQWSKKNFDASFDLSSYKETMSGFQERLRSGDGLSAALVGDNGVGKSTLVNLSVLNTMHDESTYADGRKRVPEAVRELLSGSDKVKDPPTLEKLLLDRAVPRCPHVSVQMLSPKAAAHPADTTSSAAVVDMDDAPAPAPAASATTDVETESAEAAREEFKQLESKIYKYCETEGQARPKVSNFLLPCGMAAQSTTTMHTRVRSGGTVHAMVEFATEEELQQQAYQFVQLRRDLGDDDPEYIDEARQKELKQAWHTYLGVTKGIVTVEDLPDFVDDFPDAEDLEDSWSSIQVCEALREVVKFQSILYLGGGTDLHLDRKHLHNLLMCLNDKDKLQRIAAKSVEVFVPATVLEGGCSFVDLPGLNSVNPGELAQTKEGLQHAGVVFVVLKKSLHEDELTVKLIEETGLLKRVVQTNDIEVIFITNREIDQSLRVESINTAEEAAVRNNLEMRTRALWKKKLEKVNKQLKKDNEPCRSEDDIDTIARNTQCRTIYPMTHTAFKLNVEHAVAHKEQAEAIFRESNFYWLLGSLEALNRDGYVRELERIVTVTLPGLRDKLKSSLDDAVALDQGQVKLPEQLIKMAEKWLQQTKSQSSGFNTVLDSLNEKVKMYTTGTDCFKAQLGNIVRDFMQTDASVQRFLDKAQTNQPASWRDLQDRINKKGYGSALKAIDPLHKGAFRSLEILPVAFGSKNNQVQIDFQPLVNDLEAKLQEVKEVIIDDILSSVNETLKLTLRDTPIDTSVDILKESFTTSDVLSTMNQRFHNFFSARQHAVSLKNNQPADYFKKFAVTTRVTALKTKVLSQHRQAKDVPEVCALIKDNLAATRTEWKRLVTSGIEDFIGQQFSMLYNDLTWGAKGLLKSLLRAFLQHIVQTSRMQGNEMLQQHLRRFLCELTQQTKMTHALWTRLIRRADAEELGRAAAQQFERQRHRQMIQRLACSSTSVLLGNPTMRMPPLELQRKDTPTRFSCTLTFMEGDLDRVQTLNQQVLTKYKRGVCGTGRSDLFSAFAMVVWGKRTIKERLGQDGKVNFRDGLNVAAEQLRAVCTSELRHFLRDKPTRCAKLQLVFKEPTEDYIRRLEGNEYKGDALCLYFLAHHFKQNFLLWRPGADSPTLFSPDMKHVPRTAHHLVLAAEPPTTDAPADTYDPTWFFFQDERVVKFSSSAITLIGMTDDEVDARHSQPSSTDYEMTDVVRKRPNTDGTFTTYVNGEPITADLVPSTSAGKRPRTGC